MTPALDPEGQPVTARFEVIAHRVFVSFKSDPGEKVRGILRHRRFVFGKGDGCYWRGFSAAWGPDGPDGGVKVELEAAGVVLEECQLAGCERQRKREAKKANLTVNPKAIGLADLDWSDLPEWAAKNVVIQDKKTGELIPFVFNEGQHILHAAVWEQWRTTGSVRVNVVKLRQVGATTYFCLLAFRAVYSVQAVEALLMSHEGQAVNSSFARIKLFEQTVLPRRDTKSNNAKEIEYKPPHLSALRIAITSDMRGGTRRVVIADEFAHWGGRAGAILAGLSSTVPNAAGTIVVRLSTANGVSGAFYESCSQAEKKIGAYKNVFIGLFSDKTCRAYGVPRSDRRLAEVPREWFEDEDRLREIGRVLGVSEEDIEATLIWRLIDGIPDKCQGLPELFKQEYPATFKEAFLSTGSNVFPPSIVDPALERAKNREDKEPPKRFRIKIDGIGSAFRGSLVEDPGGPLRIYKMPESSERYIVPGDVARGVNVSGDTSNSNKLDFTDFRVTNEYTGEEVAVWHGRMDPDDAAYQLAHLGRMYSTPETTCLLIPEASGIYGPILINRLVKDIRYPRVFRKEKIGTPTINPVQQEPEAVYMAYGWWTGTTMNVAKATMIGFVNEAVRTAATTDKTCRDPRLWDEMRTFVRAADGSMDAENGCHDDSLMAHAIGATYRKLHPRKRPVEPDAKPPFTPIQNGVAVSSAYLVGKIEEKRAAREKAKRAERGGFR